MSSVSVLTYINIFQFVLEGFIFKKNHSYGVTEKYWKNPGTCPGTGRYDADPGTGRVFISIPVPAEMEVIPGRYRPGQNFDPGRPLGTAFIPRSTITSSSSSSTSST